MGRPYVPWALLALAALVPATGQAQTAEEQAVIHVVENLFTAMRTQDIELLERTMIPDAFVIGVGGGGMSRSTREEFARAIVGAEAQFIERMWDPEVRIDGQVAQLWAPYDLYIGDEFSHCGSDAFHLVKVDGEWKMAGVTYSRAQPPACDKHPDGPPT